MSCFTSVASVFGVTASTRIRLAQNTKSKQNNEPSFCPLTPHVFDSHDRNIAIGPAIDTFATKEDKCINELEGAINVAPSEPVNSPDSRQADRTSRALWA